MLVFDTLPGSCVFGIPLSEDNGGHVNSTGIIHTDIDRPSSSQHVLGQGSSSRKIIAATSEVIPGECCTL